MNNPNWIAPRTGNDWRDDDVLRATEWLKSFVPARDMERRLERARDFLLEARARERDGGPTAELYDPADSIAWYILQAETYAVDRQFWVPEAVARVAPIMTRLGIELARLQTVGGVQERAERLMLSERRQPDGGLFELLVALAYRRGGWTSVDFVPETRGQGRTPDLHVARQGSRWAVECKRLSTSRYALNERRRGQELAGPVHEYCRQQGVSLIMEVHYLKPLGDVPNDYLMQRLRERLAVPGTWRDEIGVGVVRPVNWRLAQGVLAYDDVYFGSSRMIELLSGVYAHDADHSMAATWTAADERPFYAHSVSQASVVTWKSRSPAAIQAKARHFRQTIANAEGQLPSNRPGVIHVGIESAAGGDVAAQRHFRNMFEARFFEPKNSRLRWVYGNYFVPELTTAQNESWALVETMVPYKVGSHRTHWPLPDHCLLTPEAEVVPGVYW